MFKRPQLIVQVHSRKKSSPPGIICWLEDGSIDTDINSTTLVSLVNNILEICKKQRYFTSLFIS